VSELRRRGLALQGGAEVLEITADAVGWRDAAGDHETPAGAVFVTADAAPRLELVDELRTRGLDVSVVGDAVTGAGLLEHAMRTALETAVAV
jgi:hypothetical protein